LFIKRIPASALVFTLAFLCLAGTQAAAAGHGGGGGKKPSPTGTLALVPMDSTDGVAHWGQRVTFDVATTATTQPHVNVTCSQSGVVVYGTTTGYYADYPWPWTQVMTLASLDWTGGAADCVATLWYASGAKMVTLTTLNFHVSE
jgi:hypothetical protein